MNILMKLVRSATYFVGIEISRAGRKLASEMPVEFNDSERALFKFVKDNELSMTSNERLYATIMACKYAEDQNITGDFVECGVWRGGNSILAAGIFTAHRKILLFDTFDGMTEPTDIDHTTFGKTSAKEKFNQRIQNGEEKWCYSSLDEVKDNFAKAGLLSDRVKFVKGDVLKTLEDENNLPEKISVLRLDTDWYESTKKELEVLYPRLSIGGIIMIDDYGHWAGAKKAVDEYFEQHGGRPFLQYIDRTGRVGIKTQ